MNVIKLLEIEKLIAVQQNEPVSFWSVLAITLNVVQVLALPVAPWIHVVIVVASQVAAIIAARRQVTPIAKLPAQP